jgi:hypothetical protein
MHQLSYILTNLRRGYLMWNFRKTMLSACIFLSCGVSGFAQKASLGVFDSSGDVGAPAIKGNVAYSAMTQEYTLTGAGANVLNDKDQCHFVWKKISGDFIVQVRSKGFLGAGLSPHRKTGWMVRKSLATGSACVVGTVHGGDGLTALQYRSSDNATMIEKPSSQVSPNTTPHFIQLERLGTTYILGTAHDGEPMIRDTVKGINLGTDLYVGLFVCSSDAAAGETAVLDNVRMTRPAPAALGSVIEQLDVESCARQIIYATSEKWEAPNTRLDGISLIFNKNGLLYNFNTLTKAASVINTGSATSNNNDHVISWDGKTIGISSGGAFSSVVYTVPSGGGSPTLVTTNGVSYLHGWSPDNQYLIFTGQRNNDFDIYRIPVKGGQEQRLTTAAGLDDGCEYSPDGKYIYFHSVRSGSADIWRMQPDGSALEQITSDKYNDWFPHPSPDGKWLVFISFGPEVDPSLHPYYLQVTLRKVPVTGGQPQIIAYLYGGQGTINVPSWSPDSKKVYFFSNSNILQSIPATGAVAPRRGAPASHLSIQALVSNPELFRSVTVFNSLGQCVRTVDPERFASVLLKLRRGVYCVRIRSTNGITRSIRFLQD